MKLRLSEKEIKRAQKDFLPRPIKDEGPFAVIPGHKMQLPFLYHGQTAFMSSEITPRLLLKVLADWLDLNAEVERLREFLSNLLEREFIQRYADLVEEIEAALRSIPDTGAKEG